MLDNEKMSDFIWQLKEDGKITIDEYSIAMIALCVCNRINAKTHLLEYKDKLEILEDAMRMLPSKSMFTVERINMLFSYKERMNGYHLYISDIDKKDFKSLYNKFFTEPFYIGRNNDFAIHNTK